MHCRSVFDTVFYILICDGDAFGDVGNGLWTVLQPQSNCSMEDGTSVRRYATIYIADVYCCHNYIHHFL